VSPLLDRPDEILGVRLGELTEGDEVQVESRRGAYCAVLCPDGRRGWVHRTTLGDTIGQDAYQAAAGDGEAPPNGEDTLAALLAHRGIR
jgi:hypothetical protein